jgi:hypothetical protein
VTPVDAALEHLGKELDLTLKLSPQGTLQLRLRSGLSLNLEADGEATIYAYTVLAPNFADSQLAAFFPEMLEAQLFGQGTGDARFGLDTSRRELLLHQRFDMRHVELANFSTSLEQFLSAAKSWTDRLSTPTDSDVETRPVQPDVSQGGPWLRA